MAQETAKIHPQKAPPALTADSIHELLEARYGPGFAQWFIDQLQKKRA